MSETENNVHSLCNSALFELISHPNPDIPNELREYLLQCDTPWAALGKTLTAFIRAFVEKIPKEQRLRGNISPYAVIDNAEGVFIGEGAIVEPHTFISGPTYIAPGAAIRQGAYVRGSVFLCKNAVIGHTTEAKGAILLPNSKAAHFAYVGDSILGTDTNMGAGTKLANLRFDHGEVIVHFNGKKVKTGLKKFGAILGNRSQTGCNSVTNPGAILLPSAFLLPNSTGTGVVGK